MYTLISHGSRIQVAQFHYWPDSPSSERSDNPPEEKKTGDKEKIEPKPFDFKTAKQTLENNKQSEKNDITNAGNPNIELLANLERGFVMAEKLPPIVSTSLPLMGASADTAVSNIETTKPETYTVNKGDTLSKIAQLNGTTVAELAKANGITDVNKIQVGKVLNMPSNTMTATAVAGTTTEKITNTPVSQPSIATKPRVAVASKPAEAPKVAKSPEDLLAEADRDLIAANTGLAYSPGNKMYEDMKNKAQAIKDGIIATNNKNEADAKYAKLSPSRQILDDYTKEFKSLNAASIKPGFTKFKERDEALRGVMISKEIVDNETKISKLNEQYKAIGGMTRGESAERGNINKEIVSLQKTNEAQMAYLKGSPNYAAIRANNERSKA